MAEPFSSGSDERQDACGSRTETIQECPVENNNVPPVLQLRLNQPKTGNKVKWTTDTVDNEFMGKKKSKCCCIFEKQKVFGESSSSEDEGDNGGCTSHCKGHKKKCYRKAPPHNHNNGDDHHSHDHHQDGEGSVAASNDSKSV